jgi:hypothetical protein
VDDRGGSWQSSPGDQDRLAQIEDQLETLQEQVAQLTRTLEGARPEFGQRTTPGGWSTQASTAGSPTIPGRRKPSESEPLRQQAKPPHTDPIGRVGVGVDRLREEFAHLFRVLRVPAPEVGPRITPASTVQSPATPPRHTPPTAFQHDTLPHDQGDSESGDDALSSSLDPSQGPGGSGPQHEETPEIAQPEERPGGFDFLQLRTARRVVEGRLAQREDDGRAMGNPTRRSCHDVTPDTRYCVKRRLSAVTSPPHG